MNGDTCIICRCVCTSVSVCIQLLARTIPSNSIGVRTASDTSLTLTLLLVAALFLRRLARGHGVGCVAQYWNGSVYFVIYLFVLWEILMVRDLF